MNKTDVITYIAAMRDRLAGTPDFDVELRENEDGTITARSGHYPNTAATFDLERNRITADSGSRLDAGALNELLNNDTLVKNATYIVDGHIHVKTDALGRSCRFRVNYNRSWKVVHSARPTRGLRMKDGDQAGHVIAVALHGPHEFINIVPMPEEYNQGWYLFQEQMLAGALAKMEESAEDWSLDLRIDVSYYGPSLRPDSLHLEAGIDNARGYSARLSSDCVY